MKMNKIRLVNTTFVFFVLYFASGILFNGSSQFSLMSQARACAVNNAVDASRIASVQTDSAQDDEDEAQALRAPAPPNPLLRILNGRYSSIATASYPNANGKTVFANCVGLVTFDGNGRFVDRETHSYDGVIVRRVYNGTYTLKADGTGKMRFNATDGSISYDADFVISNAGRELNYIVTLSPFVSSGILKRQ